MNLKVTLFLLLLAVFWGSAFPLIKIGLEDFSPGHLTLIRFIVASACFVPYLYFTKSDLFPKLRDVPYFFLLGLLGITIYHTALNFGELYVTAGAASLIIATAPAISAILAYFFLSDRLPLLGWVGTLVSFFGVFLIVMGEDEGLSFNPYALLILLSAIVTAFFVVLQKPMLSRYKSSEVSAFATWAGTVPLFVFAPGFVQEVSTASTAPLLAAIYIGVFPAAISYAIFSYALSKAPVTVVTAFLYTVPVFSIVFSWLLIDEVPTYLTLIGGVVAILGIVMVNWAKRRVRVAARHASPSAAR